MQIHIFAFRWTANATAADKERATGQIRDFAGRIPGLLEVHVGENTATNGQGFEAGGVMQFASPLALEAYNSHPLHEALLAWVSPLIEAVEVDFVSPSP